jgi:hypothetical protein
MSDFGETEGVADGGAEGQPGVSDGGADRGAQQDEGPEVEPEGQAAADGGTGD